MIPALFVNYFAERTRESPINLAGARIVLGSYILWRGASIDVRALTEWPVHFITYLSFTHPPDGFEWVLIVEKFLLLVGTLFFIIGYRTRISSFIVGALFSHLTGVMRVMNLGGETDQMALGALCVFLFGLYCEQDELSVDGIRRTGRLSMKTLNERLQRPDDGRFSMTSLKLILLTLGISYAASPVARFFNPGWLAWASADNFARFLLVDGNELGLPGFDIIVNAPYLLTLFAVLTLVVEAGLLLSALTRLPITPMVIGLFGMHTAIALTVGLFFLDMFFFLLLLLSFDRIHASLSADREIDVVYDGNCYFCARSLQPFKLIDTKGSISWYNQYTAPDSYLDDERVDVEARMYVFVNGKPYGGYDAFQQLFKQFPETVPISMAMSIPPVAAVGERLYRYIAANRSRHFKCSVSTQFENQED